MTSCVVLPLLNLQAVAHHNQLTLLVLVVWLSGGAVWLLGLPGPWLRGLVLYEEAEVVPCQASRQRPHSRATCHSMSQAAWGTKGIGMRACCIAEAHGQRLRVIM